jgi:hypothetical protein
MMRVMVEADKYITDSDYDRRGIELVWSNQIDL